MDYDFKFIGCKPTLWELEFVRDSENKIAGWYWKDYEIQNEIPRSLGESVF